jgi:hypothetical protein
MLFNPAVAVTLACSILACSPASADGRWRHGYHDNNQTVVVVPARKSGYANRNNPVVVLQPYGYTTFGGRCQNNLPRNQAFVPSPGYLPPSHYNNFYLPPSHYGVQQGYGQPGYGHGHGGRNEITIRFD